MRPRALLRALVVAVVAALPLLLGCNEGNPIILIHGYEGTGCSGIDTHDMWGGDRDGDGRGVVGFLRAQGWTGRIHPVVYYECDKHWTDEAKNVYAMYLDAGKPGGCPHAEHYNSGHVGGTGCGGQYVHTTDTKINHLGYHLAWEIWNRYSKVGRPVEIWAHSMGGLIARYALAKTEEGHPDFPPYLLVSDVVTFGTPHKGANSASLLCVINCPVEVTQMKPGSPFLDALDTPIGRHPDGRDGTQWMTIGSNDDDTVSEGSATGMHADVEVIYWNDSDIEHGRYFDRTTTAATAHSTTWNYKISPAKVTETHAAMWPVMAGFFETWAD